MIPKLKKRDKIYLLIKNLKKKPTFIKVKPFFIKAKRRTVSYKLELFKNIKIYSIFYLLLSKFIDFQTCI